MHQACEEDLELAFVRAMLTHESDPAAYTFNDVETAVIQSYGYVLSATREHTCKTCHQLAKGACCAGYSRSNRIHGTEVSAIIWCMEDFIVEAIHHQCNFWPSLTVHSAHKFKVSDVWV